MADRPILFSAPMVCALLDGRKTQTRRVMHVQPPRQEDFPHSPIGIGRRVADGVKLFSLNDYARLPKHPTKWDLDGAVGVARKAGFPMEYDARFAVGDRLWVKETWRAHRAFDDQKPSLIGTEARVWYEADRDNCDQHGKVRVSIFMPRWASRLTLTVTDVRLQRLQECSEADALAEGVVEYEPTMEDPAEFAAFDGASVFNNAVSAYQDLWNRINGPGAWEANPWVVAVTFDVKEGNIDG
ncbi:hypothetical protein [Sphingobium sp. B2]|uniref:hypothetical protein n=1 Tax=Sphingobium sp. B2 TaxID=2583228 RepID=UPI0011A6223D|nr:hypothetical protein [Sphingobium sp. B2]